MALVVINDSVLKDIADAIRDRNFSEDAMTPARMVEEIYNLPEAGSFSPMELGSIDITENGEYYAVDYEDIVGFASVNVNVPTGGGDLPEEALVITGACNYRFAYDGWNWFIENYGNRINTNIDTAQYMFSLAFHLEEIPFDINFNQEEEYHEIAYMFQNCSNLKALPKLNNCKPNYTYYMFSGCNKLREIPDDFCDTWDWTYTQNQTSSSYGQRNNMFDSCFSLRHIPTSLITYANPNSSYRQSMYYGGFSNCKALDEIIGLGVPYKGTWTSNSFSGAFNKTSRVKNITFALQEGGAPYVVKWHTQTIDLSQYTGYASALNEIITTVYNNGITEDKRVSDDTTYQALKDDADWFTTDVAYSRYNHDSAVATINSLPDTSAYLATLSGKSNTIKFKGASGSATDGGAINTLTEEEIAVAAAKGWTVSFV